jgi:hypothetical protein
LKVAEFLGANGEGAVRVFGTGRVRGGSDGGAVVGGEGEFEPGLEGAPIAAETGVANGGEGTVTRGLAGGVELLGNSGWRSRHSARVVSPMPMQRQAAFTGMPSARNMQREAMFPGVYFVGRPALAGGTSLAGGGGGGGGVMFIGAGLEFESILGCWHGAAADSAAPVSRRFSIFTPTSVPASGRKIK